MRRRAPRAHLKVITTLVQRGEFPKILAYCKKVNYTPEWPHLLSGILNMNPDGAVQLAVSLNEMDPPPLMPNQVVEMADAHPCLFFGRDFCNGREWVFSPQVEICKNIGIHHKSNLRFVDFYWFNPIRLSLLLFFAF
jgi:hypothetical protein